MAEHFLMQMVLTLFQSAHALAHDAAMAASDNTETSQGSASRRAPLDSPTGLTLITTRSFSQGDNHSHSSFRPFGNEVPSDVLRTLTLTLTLTLMEGSIRCTTFFGFTYKPRPTCQYSEYQDSDPSPNPNPNWRSTCQYGGY